MHSERSAEDITSDTETRAIQRIIPSIRQNSQTHSWAMRRKFMSSDSTLPRNRKQRCHRKQNGRQCRNVKRIFHATDLIILDVSIFDRWSGKEIHNWRTPALCLQNWTPRNVKVLCEQIIEIYTTKKEHHMKNKFYKKIFILKHDKFIRIFFNFNYGLWKMLGYDFQAFPHFL